MFFYTFMKTFFKTCIKNIKTAKKTLKYMFFIKTFFTSMH